MSTVGARLKEERLKMALSQEKFAQLGGLTKQTIIKYENDERAPDALFLQSLSAAGADTLYIVTGRREVMLPASLEAYNTLTANAFCDSLEARFRHLEPWPLPEDIRASLNAERVELDRIARIEALPDKVRARADQMLLMAFDDTEACGRLDNRFRAIRRRLLEADAAIERAARIAGTEAPPQLKAALLKMVADYAIEAEELAPLLSLVVRESPQD